MTLKLLAVGDIHLGRGPSARVPEDGGYRPADLGPAAAWRRTVELAIEEQVHAVVLAGDVIEGENDFFEGYRALQAGVEELVAKGIRVLGVAGNHDVKVLPRLAGQIGDFELVGTGGRWEQVTIEAGAESVTLWGWSFPNRTVSYSPVADVGRFERTPGLNIGVLHCDRDQSQSSHAPVRSAELEHAELDAWLLGHIHKPDPISAENPSGYLGCLTGMDPGEPGDHGPWLMQIDNGRISSFDQRVIAPLRWDRLDLDLTGLGDPDDGNPRLIRALQNLDARLSEYETPPSMVGLRLSLVGTCDIAQKVEKKLGSERGVLHLGARGTGYFVEAISSVVQPTISLKELARSQNPPGLLARRLLILERAEDDEERAALIAQASGHLASADRNERWAELAMNDELDSGAVAKQLREAGLRVLEAMLANGPREMGA